MRGPEEVKGKTGEVETGLRVWVSALKLFHQACAALHVVRQAGAAIGPADLPRSILPKPYPSSNSNTISGAVMVLATTMAPVLLDPCDFCM